MPTIDDYDLPEELFCLETSELSRENYLKHLEQAVVADLVSSFQAMNVREAAAHVRGCARRLLMMRHARVEVTATTHEATGPLSNDQGNLLNICVNSFYVNLLGALDNLAWASTFELGLLKNPSEDDADTRHFCSLASGDFRRRISGVRPSIGVLVADMQGWLREVKRFRDPATHRLPLSIMPGVMTDVEETEYRGLYQRAWDLMLEHRVEEAEQYFEAASAVGRFFPYLDGPTAMDGSYIVAPQLMADDQRKFLDFTHRWVGEMRAPPREQR
jgi:hypothetical protein